MKLDFSGITGSCGRWNFVTTLNTLGDAGAGNPPANYQTDFDAALAAYLSANYQGEATQFETDRAFNIQFFTTNHVNSEATFDVDMAFTNCAGDTYTATTGGTFVASALQDFSEIPVITTYTDYNTADDTGCNAEISFLGRRAMQDRRHNTGFTWLRPGEASTFEEHMSQWCRDKAEQTFIRDELELEIFAEIPQIKEIIIDTRYVINSKAR